MKKFGIENPAMKPTPIFDEEGRRLVKEAEDKDFELAQELLPAKYRSGSNGKNGTEKSASRAPADILDLATSAEAEEVKIDSDLS
ncbi:MAG: hypothetical protein A2571_02750 [Candidatus Vogelbacteria bacterium RIFOXYD1_FULL_44_32]|uniref:Uncharacterized protein n=1 Tax=Candidatus Vogelbacteria bacterium RIFOXYD1_FULL_44_32 TaxID=1802438 RepID=A0A1G2QDN0_9BACT|nr:MAG: hypothetical protein A2571_02750 [Candidatus Vogelbacteria bacterium RIFOXYD1_FULL_44_32]